MNNKNRLRAISDGLIDSIECSDGIEGIGYALKEANGSGVNPGLLGAATLSMGVLIRSKVNKIEAELVELLEIFGVDQEAREESKSYSE